MSKPPEDFTNVLKGFREDLMKQAKEALIAVVRAQPKTTCADLAEVIGGNAELGEITLAELLGSKAPASAPVRSKKKKKP